MYLLASPDIDLKLLRVSNIDEHVSTISVHYVIRQFGLGFRSEYQK